MTKEVEVLSSPHNLPDYEPGVDDYTVQSLLNKAADAYKTMRSAIKMVEMAANSSQSSPHGDSAPRSGEFVEQLMQGPMRLSDRADGILYALDTLATIKDGSSWETTARQIAERTEKLQAD